MFRTIKLDRYTCASAQRLRSLIRSTSLILGFLAVASASAKASTLYAASPYNVFVFGGFSESGDDDEGRLAVGGNASFSGTYAVMQAPLDSQSAPNNDSLVVGGKVTAGTVDVDSGNAFLQTAGGGGSISMSSGTLTTGGTDPIDFSSAQTSLTSYSAYLSTLTANGTVSNNGSGTITLTGTSSTLNIFSINASLLGGSNTININFPTNATVLINVIGTSLTTTNSGVFVNGNPVNGNSTTTQVDNILFNFYQATTLTIDGGFLGSILAPGAAVTGANYQQLDGQLIAASFTGETEFHDFLFTGTLPTQTSATPEPGSFAMLGIGLILLGSASRKWRKR